MTIAEWIRSNRRKKGMSQTALARRAKVTVDTISRAEIGKTVPQWGTLTALCEVFGIPFEQVEPLLKVGGAPAIDVGEANVGAPVRLPAEPPVFELSVAAGGWADVGDVEGICDPAQIEQGIFCVRLAGDSMMPDYPNGQVVAFRCLPRGREELVVGRDYYVQRHDGCATFKRLSKIGARAYTLVAINAARYPKPIVVAAAQVQRMARAVARVEML